MHFMMWDPRYFLFIGPAVLLGMWAQFRVRATYLAAQKQPAPLSGVQRPRGIFSIPTDSPTSRSKRFPAN